MKRWMIISLLVLGIIAVSSISYAWFTYVQRKSLVSFVSHEMTVDLKLSDQPFSTSMHVKGLTYVSMEKEVFSDEISDGFNEVGMKHVIRFHVPVSSPSLKVNMTITQPDQHVFYLLIDEGYEQDPLLWEHDYHAILRSIYQHGDTHQLFKDRLSAYNQSIVSHLKTLELKPGETYVMQWIIWVDMDELPEQQIDPSIEYSLLITFHTMSGKGVFDDE